MTIQEQIEQVIPKDGEMFYICGKYVDRCVYFIRTLSMLLGKDMRKRFVIIDRPDKIRGRNITTILMLPEWYRERRSSECHEIDEYIKYNNLKVIDTTDKIFDGIEKIEFNENRRTNNVYPK